MTTYVSLLRGINLGPHKKVKMEGLVALYTSMDLEHVRTYLRSGNVLFDSDTTEPIKLAAMLEEQITRALDFPMKVIIRTGDELHQVVTHNPFLPREDRDTRTLHVTFLSDLPSENLVGEMSTIQDEVDSFEILGKDVYLFCPKGYGRTRFSNAFFEKKLGVIATTRNWKTVTALAEMAKG
jgi:uncharacterized protein (DUF1697 family)